MRQFSTNEHSRAFSPFREFHNRTLLYSSNLCSSSSSSEDETANCVFKEVLITNKRKIYIHTHKEQNILCSVRWYISLCQWLAVRSMFIWTLVYEDFEHGTFFWKKKLFFHNTKHAFFMKKRDQRIFGFFEFLI